MGINRGDKWSKEKNVREENLFILQILFLYSICSHFFIEENWPNKFHTNSSTKSGEFQPSIMHICTLFVYICIFPYFFGTSKARIMHGIILSLIRAFQNNYATYLFNYRLSSGFISCATWFYKVAHGTKSISCIGHLWC